MVCNEVIGSGEASCISNSGTVTAPRPEREHSEEPSPIASFLRSLLGGQPSLASIMRILFNQNLFKITVKCFKITTFIFPGAPQSHQGARDAMKLVPSGTGGETDTTTESDTTTVVSSTD